MTGKENFGWFRFDARHDGGPIFHTHQLPPSRRARACAQRGELYRHSVRIPGSVLTPADSEPIASGEP
jgi:hypothetical protein